MGAAHGVGGGAVLRDHQRQAAVDDGLAGQIFFQVPHLLVPQLEGHGGAGEALLLQKEEGAAVEHIEPEVAPQLQPQTLRHGEVAQVAQHGAGEVGGALQRGAEGDLVPGAVDPGQHGKEAGELCKGGRFHCIQQLQGNIHGVGQAGQFFRQLVRPGDGHGELGLFRRGGRFRQGRLGKHAAGPLPPDGAGGELRGELLQRLAAQAVEGAGGEHEPLVQLHLDGLRREHGAAGLAQALPQLACGKGAAARRLRHGAGDLRGGAAGPGGEESGLSGAQSAAERNGGEPVLAMLIQGPLGGEELLGPAGVLRAGAQHVGALAACEVAVGKAAAAEGGLQHLPLLGGGAAALVQQPAVNGGDHSHILRPLHAALDLQTGHAHILQLPQVAGEIGVLQAQRVAAPAGAVHPVGQAAGLGAGAPVAAALADEGAHGALAGVAHAQGAVDEHFHLRAAAGADPGDVLPAQLPGQHHPLQTQFPGPAGAAQGEKAHLGAGVERQVRHDGPGQGQQAPVLHQHGVHAQGLGPTEGLRRGG